MSKSITMSFSAPLELSIQMEEHMETMGFNRSELIKNALIFYLKNHKDNINNLKLLEDTYNNTIEIKKNIMKLINTK